MPRKLGRTFLADAPDKRLSTARDMPFRKSAGTSLYTAEEYHAKFIAGGNASLSRLKRYQRLLRQAK